MVSEIRIYIEGGGNNNTSRRRMRGGFGEFFSSLRDLARQNRLGWNLILCGSRSEAFENFKLATRTHPDAFNVLLVDAESPVKRSAWQHLLHGDGWRAPADVEEAQCHLMVQAVEAWLVADPDTLAAFYGQGFRRNALPRAEDVETIGKERLLSALVQATEPTQKGRYHKIDHCAALLERIDHAQVRARATHCDRLFQVVEERIRSNP